MIKIVLFQPDNPKNVGAFLRLSACLGVELHIIEPCGFLWDEKRLKRVAMDYGQLAEPIRHASWNTFLDLKQAIHSSRLLLLTTKSSEPYTSFQYQSGDMLLLGSESSGVPDYVHQAADARLTIPMSGSARSLNVVNAASMVTGEALRQTVWS